MRNLTDTQIAEGNRIAQESGFMDLKGFTQCKPETGARLIDFLLNNY